MEPAEIRPALTAFVEYRQLHLKGDEKGEAQIYLERLFQAFGHGGIREAGATLEDRIHRFEFGGVSYADLMWKPRVLIEMKKAGSDLTRHYRQAFDYWMQAVPDRPRYVILCNFDEFWVYDFDVQLDEPVDRIAVDELPARYEALAFMLPEPEEPIFSNDLVKVTREAAVKVSGVFRSMHARGIERLTAQHFVLQSVVAMFAEDIGLLPSHFFTRTVREAKNGAEAYDLLGSLFREMNTLGKTAGGRFAGTPYFNGGLFASIEPVEMTLDELQAMRDACDTDWSAVRPEIFGTLFETSMDEGERHAYGAHFTSQADIMKVVGPCIVDPWRARIFAASPRRVSFKVVEQILLDMANFRVLDPACGSGNFLYVAYREMRRLEADAKRLIEDKRRAERFTDQSSLSYVTPDHFFGMDTNAFAVEVAKVTMTMAKKLAADELDENVDALPLENLDDQIVARDALFTPWPKADVIIGNPPYLGRRKMVSELGADYCARLAETHPAVAGVSDFVTYWFPIAHATLPNGGRCGFVATQAIRDGDSRKASLDHVVSQGGVIFDAVSSQPWSGDAAVTVSIINWVKGAENAPPERTLWIDKGQLRLPVDEIPASLKPSTDVARAVPLAVNKNPKRCFQGQTTGNVEGFRLTRAQALAIAREAPAEAQYIHPMTGGDSLIKEITPSRFVIDLPFTDRVDAEANAPTLLRHLRPRVLPGREEAAAKEAEKNAVALARNPKAKINRHHQNFLATWWRHAYRREDLLRAVRGLDRFIGLTRVAADGRRSIYQFLDPAIRPDDQVQCFAFDDDYSFGILSSSTHRAWFDERCSRLETRPRYTSTTVFDSFPWPANPDSQSASRVAECAAAIIKARGGYAAQGLSLAQIYDTLREPGQSSFRDLHLELDAAVIDLYGFSSEDDLLAQLLALNLAAADDPESSRTPGGWGLEGVRISDYRLTAQAL